MLENPDLKEKVEEKVKVFVISQKVGRSKSAVPSLGEFLLYLAVSEEYHWDDLAITYVKGRGG